MHGVSALQISIAADPLDEQIETWTNRPQQEADHLLLDATHKIVRIGHQVISAVILAVIGITPEIQYCALRSSLSASEAEVH